MGAEKFGGYYWGVRVMKHVSPTGKIYLHADTCEISPNGDLLLKRVKPEGGRNHEVNLALAPGYWLYVFAASVFDGSPAAVDHWEGEVTE